MFSPAAMLRLNAIVLARHERSVLESLGRLGAIQLARGDAGAVAGPMRPPDRTRELSRCDRLLAKVAEILRSLEVAEPSDASMRPMTFEEAEGECKQWEERASAWIRRRAELQEGLGELAATSERVRPYSAFETPLDKLEGSSFLHFLTGSLPAGALEQMALPEEGVLLRLPMHNGRQPVMALSLEQNRKGLDDVLRKADFQREVLPSRPDMSPQQLLSHCRIDRERLEEQLQAVQQEGQSLGRAAEEPLGQVQRWAMQERRLLEAEQLLFFTASTVLVSGWIPAANVQAVRSELETATNGSCVIKTDEPGDDVAEEDIPVLLLPSRWLRPFQLLVSAYGFPKYRELAPTLFVAISYVLMFGMMVGDVGHGGLLALAGAGLLLAGRGDRVRDGAVLLLVNGLASAGFGLAYGSCFGLPQFKKYALWRDPLEGDPMNLMLAAIGLGVGLMSLGVGLNIINRWRRREWTEGLLDKFGLTGLIFYWGTLLLLTRAGVIQARGWWKWALVLLLVAPISCWIIKEPLLVYRKRQAVSTRSLGGIPAALTESLVGAFEGVLLYLANTVSFVRLAAYAMSHAALLMATFTVADQLREFQHGGTVLAIGVVILGNAVAMLLEGMVAAVQALRLEYYEFFGKFFTGDGQPFRPFSLAAAARG